MLPRKNRIKRALFEEIIEKSRVLHGNYFTLRLYKKSEGEPQFTVVVSKKIAKTAAKRNLLKRRVRAAIQSLIKDIKKPIAGVFFLKKEITTAKFIDVKEEIERVIMKSL